ncbi:MAG: endonuclease/exonuclease/phosphatase family protein, partial [Flavobacteriales bacterium]
MKAILTFLYRLFLPLFFGLYALKYLPLDAVKHLPFFSYFFPVCLVVLGLYFVIQIRSIKTWNLKTYLLFLFFLSQCAKFIQFSLPYQSQPVDFSVLTFNAQSFMYNKQKSRWENQEKVQDFLNQHQADVVCFQEIYWKDYNLYHPFSTTLKTTTVINSKFPIVNQGQFQTEDEEHSRNIFADIVIKNDTFRIYNLHLQSFHLIEDSYDLVNNADQYFLGKKTNALSPFKTIISKFSQAYINKAKQLRLIEDNLSQCPYPSFIIGDFNDIVHTNTYHRLSKHHSDSWFYRGTGFGASFSG